MLQITTYGNGPGRPLLIIHGLFGSARNWGVIAKRLSEHRQVVTVDMRNHGSSPWFETHSYQDMADDLAQMIRSLDGPVDVVGHSMGGKASMILALQTPELVNRLIVADIAPVTYSHSQMGPLDAMQGVDLSKVEKRSDAAALMTGVEPGVRAFLLQSLDVKQRRWSLNLDVLKAEMPKIMGFPDIGGQFTHPTLFLSGSASDYVQPAHRETIKQLFPKAKFSKIPGAGHWLHAEKPREFTAAVQTFLDMDIA